MKPQVKQFGGWALAGNANRSLGRIHAADRRTAKPTVSLNSRGFIVAILVGTAVCSLGAPAAPVSPPSNEFKPRLNNSVYEPVKTRDPFLPPGFSGMISSTIKAADPTVFHLDGFLGATNNLTAIVNGLALSLNKAVVLETENGRMTIKAVQISLSGVVLEVGG